MNFCPSSLRLGFLFHFGSLGCPTGTKGSSEPVEKTCSLPVHVRSHRHGHGRTCPSLSCLLINPHEMPRREHAMDPPPASCTAVGLHLCVRAAPIPSFTRLLHALLRVEPPLQVAALCCAHLMEIVPGMDMLQRCAIEGRCCCQRRWQLLSVAGAFATKDGQSCCKVAADSSDGRRTRVLQRAAGPTARLLPATDTIATKGGRPCCKVAASGGD
jgi:hypothetical protein